MAKSSKLRVMISSRCNDRFPNTKQGTRLSEIRKDLRDEIEADTFLGRSIFEVWINEDAPPQGGTWDSWDTCIQAAKDCDVLLVLSNGNAGWAQTGGEVGICHAELMTGFSTAPAKVRLVDLGMMPITNDAEGQRNERFQEYVQKQSLFRGGTVTSVDMLKDRAKEALYDAILRLAQAGVREGSRGRFHSGDALDWTRLDYETRRREMRRVLRDTILQYPGSVEAGNNVVARFAEADVLVVPDAIPAALSIGQAKEMVGQPFLRDHKLIGSLVGRAGPLHVIGCHKNATESQATKMLGFPDATVVAAPFGVFVADAIQKVQFAFVVNCRDESTTRHGIQRFFEWMAQTGEDVRVAVRAQARARIVAAIAAEVVA